MNLCRCEKGHFYDREKYASCPHCVGGRAADNGRTAAFTEDVTEPLTQPDLIHGRGQMAMPRPGDKTERYDPMDLPVPNEFADLNTEAIYSSHVDMPTEPLIIPQTVMERVADDDEHTIGIYDDIFISLSPAKDGSLNSQDKAATVNKVSTPCVGWLIALSGEHIGTDFRLKTGKNFIGRSGQMDVALTEDKSVSRDRHSIVVYEPRSHMYLVQPGESSSLVYKNDEVVLTPVKLEAYDVITVGDVDLLFIPLCGARFNWGDHLKKIQSNIFRLE